MELIFHSTKNRHHRRAMLNNRDMRTSDVLTQTDFHQMNQPARELPDLIFNSIQRRNMTSFSAEPFGMKTLRNLIPRIPVAAKKRLKATQYMQLDGKRQPPLLSGQAQCETAEAWKRLWRSERCSKANSCRATFFGE